MSEGSMGLYHVGPKFDIGNNNKIKKQYFKDDFIWFIVFNTTFSYIMATRFSGGGSQRTTDHGQATGKLYHLRV